jgi:hypothetical protein
MHVCMQTCKYLVFEGKTTNITQYKTIDTMNIMDKRSCYATTIPLYFILFYFISLHSNTSPIPLHYTTLRGLLYGIMYTTPNPIHSYVYATPQYLNNNQICNANTLRSEKVPSSYSHRTTDSSCASQQRHRFFAAVDHDERNGMRSLQTSGGELYFIQ